MADTPEPPPNAYVPRYPLQPLPTAFQVGVGRTGEGVAMVTVTFIDMNGERTYFVGGEQAVALGAAINRQGRQVMVEEAALNKHIALPNGKMHIVKDQKETGDET